ncbi:MAG: GAF domain-containing protein, partial [Gammaproteobacteria bacterium]|nr:GAF domain-containing protein [Gammaproteobacteria bacterium]
MIKPAIPHDEEARVAALKDTGVLDTCPEERFDRYTRLTRRLFDVPIALVSLVDRERQWFKSKQGLEASETPRDISFCGHAILGDEIFVVENASNDERFHDNPLVTEDPSIRFYAGCPLTSPDGHRLGTLCIIDCEPRVLQSTDLDALQDIAAMVSSELAALRLATIDELTGLSNRRAFNMIADQ